MKNNTIDSYRRRITSATLTRMKRKTGSCRLTVSMPDDNIQFIDIDEEAMLQLLQRFEKQSRNEFGEEAEEFLQKTYMKSIDINRNTEYLTETGKMIVDEIFAELIKRAKEKYVSGGIN
ncbi:hypothetical protein ACWKX9_20500 [Enterobacter asburiae]